jgi:hypothetical protein
MVISVFFHVHMVENRTTIIPQSIDDFSYTDWEGIPIDPQPADGAAFAPLLSPEAGEDGPKPLVPTLTAVPDSCCLKATPGCGKAAFTDELTGGTVREGSLRCRCTDQPAKTFFL